MAGEFDEELPIDGGPDVLTTPRRKPTYQDYWNAAYRGLVPGGIQTSNDSTAPLVTNTGTGTDAAPWNETDEYIDEPTPDVEIQPVPIVIIDDLSRVSGSVEKFIRTYQQAVFATGTTLLVNRNPFNSQVRLRNLGITAFDVSLGHNESIGTTGYPLVPGAEIVIHTTREIWAQQITPQSTPSIIAVFVEYDKET